MNNLKHNRMKRIMMLILVAASCCNVSAQEHVLDYEGDLYFIPASMTKYGEPFLYSRHGGTLTIYDGDLKQIKTYTDPLAGSTYQRRIVWYKCLADPETHELLTEWEKADEQTYEETIYAEIQGFEVYSDDNSYHTRQVYLTQTFFDDDEDFEFLQRDISVIPITIKQQDYYDEHSEPSSIEDGPTDSIYPEDEWWRDYGAEGYDVQWDEERGKIVLRLQKSELYGGLFYSNLKIKSIDGTVKQTLAGVHDFNEAYNYRGNCYIKAGNNKLYRIGKKKDQSAQKARGDVDGNGVVNAADHVKLTEIIMNQ